MAALLEQRISLYHSSIFLMARFSHLNSDLLTKLLIIELLISHPAMLKKEGIIETKISSKPSFKNLFNIEGAKVPSRSKSRNKSISQKKVSALPFKKSPQKLNSNIKAVEDQ